MKELNFANGTLGDWGVHYRDLSEALSFFELGAKGQHAGCMGALALAYRCGEGTARDDALALHWARFPSCP